MYIYFISFQMKWIYFKRICRYIISTAARNPHTHHAGTMIEQIESMWMTVKPRDLRPPNGLLLADRICAMIK